MQAGGTKSQKSISEAVRLLYKEVTKIRTSSLLTERFFFFNYCAQIVTIKSKFLLKCLVGEDFNYTFELNFKA